VINCRQAVLEGGMLGKKVDRKAARWHGARKAVVGLLSMRSPHSILSFLSVGSILSAGSILSIGSVGSILGLGSAGYSPSRERDDQEES
jgi:hypothetical protein